METWKEVAGTLGMYEVSDQGRVRSWKKQGNAGGRAARPAIMTPAPNTGGYPALVLNGRTKLVHVLVLETFVGPRPGHWRQWQACHGPRGKECSALDNLRWDTVAGNAQDRVDAGMVPKGERHANAVLTDAQVEEIKERLKTYKYGDSVKIASDYGISPITVRSIKNGTRRK